jgi:hypothetical protein
MDDTTLDTELVDRCEVIDHREETGTPGRFYVAYDVRVRCLLQDEGHTLKVYLDDRPDSDVEGDMHEGLKAVFSSVVSRRDFDRLARRVEELEAIVAGINEDPELAAFKDALEPAEPEESPEV